MPAGHGPRTAVGKHRPLIDRRPVRATSRDRSQAAHPSYHRAMDALDMLPEHTAFLAGRHHATIATLDDDGAPRQAVIWYAHLDDGRILINSRHPRRWCSNLIRDGRIALAIAERPDRWLGLTGTVDEVIEDVE